MADWGFNVTRAGYEVLTETDPRNLSFTSRYRALNVIQTGSTTITCGSGSTGATNTITHALGYVPVVMCRFDDSGIIHQLPVDSGVVTFGSGISGLTFRVTSSSLMICAFPINGAPNKFTGTKNLSVTYYIFQNRLV